MRPLRTSPHTSKLWRSGALLVCGSLLLAVACGDSNSSSSTDAAGAGGDDDSRPDGAPSLSGGGSGGSSGDEGGSSGLTGQAGDDAVGGTAGEGGSGDPGPMTLEKLCDDMPLAMCDWLDRCRSWSDSACVFWWGTQTVQHLCADGVEAVADGRLILDAVEAQACYDASLNTACDALVNTPPIAVGGGACARMLRGTAAVGDDCYQNIVSGFSLDECGEGHCVFDDACPGTCVAYLGEGDACSESEGGRCATGLFCDGVECRGPLAAGDPCGAGSDFCAEGLACTVNDVAGRFECTAEVALGGTCEHSGQCWGGSLCVDGECRDMVASGERCNSSEQCPALHGCLFDAGEAFGTCEAGAAEGEQCAPECDSRQCTPFCIDGLRCMSDGQGSGTCERPGLGATCNAQNRCTEGYCGPEDTCVPLIAAGEPCIGGFPNFTRQCEYGNSCLPVAETGDEHVCAPPGHVGDLCDAGFHCNPGSYCDVEARRCQPALAEGSTCQTTAQCVAPFLCIEGTCQHVFEASTSCRL